MSVYLQLSLWSAWTLWIKGDVQPPYHVITTTLSQRCARSSCIQAAVEAATTLSQGRAAWMSVLKVLELNNIHINHTNPSVSVMGHDEMSADNGSHSVARVIFLSFLFYCIWESETNVSRNSHLQCIYCTLKKKQLLWLCAIHYLHSFHVSKRTAHQSAKCRRED